ncbi:MAG TPA: ATP-binding protein [Casimicrobiaceae bacterium]|nr:ATP-binding protein [Casimicrobiaceae bacterium]
MLTHREFSSPGRRIFTAIVLACTLALAPAAGAVAPPLQELVSGRFVQNDSPLPPTAANAGEPIMLPDPWSVNRPAAKGYAWYLFDWTLAEPPEAVYVVYLPGTNVQAQVFVNDTLVGATGDLGGRLPRSWERSQAFAIPFALPHQGSNRIAVRVNVPAAWAGGLAPIVVGPSVEVRRLAFADLMVHEIGPALVSVTIIVLGLFILALWTRRREPTYALFGASAILWGAHTLVSALPAIPIPQPHWSVWWHGIYLAFVCLLCLFCLRFTGARWPLYQRVVIGYAFAVVPVLYLAVAADVAADTAVAIRAGGILLVGVALFAVARYAVRMRNTESALLLGAGAVSTAFAVHDWRAANDPYQIREVWLVPYAALAFLVLVGWILIDRFVRALNEAERSNVELERRVTEKSAALALQLARTQEARDAAQAADRAKSRFLAAASHDLRQPLHALGLFAAQLPAHVRDAEGTGLADRIRGSVESLESLLSALLDISKLDAGAVEAHPQPVALDALFARLASDFAPIALERGLKLALVPTRHVVRSDPVLLERILRNLVDNALKHTTSGGVVVGARPRGAAIVIEVHDSGAGIPASERERVFEEFYQIANPERDRSRGLGLGLAIVRRLAGLLGHRIEVDSEPGRGSTFRVFAERDRTTRLPRAESVATPAGSLAGRRILVVDDEADVRVGTANLLASWGSDCVAAASVDEAIASAGHRPPDAMIVDWRLAAGATGFDAVARLRAAFGAAIPALIVSGASAPEDLALIKATGMPLLHKPVAPAKLRSAIAFLLGAR